MFSVLIGVIVGSLAKTWMQLEGATAVVVAVLTLVINFVAAQPSGDTSDRNPSGLDQHRFGFRHQSAAGSHRRGRHVRLSAGEVAQAAHYLTALRCEQGSRASCASTWRPCDTKSMSWKAKKLAGVIAIDNSSYPATQPRAQRHCAS
jgi:hypothetical protein